MTVKEAFAQAFDEAFVMDAAPSTTGAGGGNSSSSSPSKPSSNQNITNSAAAPTAGGQGGTGSVNTANKGTGKGDTQSMAAHMQQYHKDGFDPTKNKCKFFDMLKRNFQAQGLSEEEATKRALAAHNSSGYAMNSSPDSSNGVNEEQGRQMAMQMAQQLKQNPTIDAIEQLASTAVAIVPPITIDVGTEDEIKVEDTFQLACVMYLDEMKQNSNDPSVSNPAAKALQTLSTVTGTEQGGIPPAGQQQVEQPQQTITTSNGQSSFIIEPEEAAIIAEEPDKKGLLQNMVDLEDRAFNLDPDSPELNDVMEEYSSLETLFLGPERQQIKGLYPQDDPANQIYVMPQHRTATNGRVDVEATQKAREQFLNDAKPGTVVTLGWGRKAVKNEDGSWTLTVPKRVNGYQKPVEEYDDGGSTTDVKKYQSTKTSADISKYSNFKVDGKRIDTLVPDVPLSTEPNVDNVTPIQPPAPPPPEGSDGDNSESQSPLPQNGETPASTDGGNGGDGGTNEPESPSPTSENPSSPSNPANPPSNGPTESGENKERTPPPAPPDSKFRIGDDKYKIGGRVYTDVSGKGLLRTMLAAFMAGLRGEGIITGWDKISGAWDEMKRSESGEMVRDGISGALIQSTIADYAAKEGLSDDAKMELAVIQDMASQAKSPKDNMAAVKQFQAWKEKYSDELGELDRARDGQVFEPLPNEYKGQKPPVDILGEPKGYQADREYGQQVASAIHTRLSQLGFPMVDEEPTIGVGPSATTIEFKVPPTFDMASAKSAKTMESLKGAIGAPVSKIGYADGKQDTLEITITNKEMRPVFFSDMMHSDEWQEFSKNGKIPLALGKDSKGKNKLLELTKMPHLMVTGATHSGKSVFLLSALNSAEMAKTPDELRVVCIDPKEEFKSQKGSPHLLYPIPSKKRDIANVVASLRAEMEKRISQVGGTEDTYDPKKNEFTGNSNRNIDGYNAAHPDQKMPHIMVVFDEVADCMKDPEFGKQIEADMDRIMALGRSVGINCILATQRNDVASLSGSIQANMPAHLMFRASNEDAKASKAAKSLAGNGDYILAADGEETRGRGCYITDENVAAVPAYYRDHMSGSEGGGDGPQLPDDYVAQIKDAVANGQSVAMEVDEGFYDVFKGSFPEDWTITEEEDGEKKYWRASPPTKPPEGDADNPTTPKLKDGYSVEPPPEDAPEYRDVKWFVKDADGSTQGFIYKDGTRSFRGETVSEGEKAPWESDEPSSQEGSEGQPSPDEPEKVIEKVEDVDDNVDYDDVNSLKDYVERLKEAKSIVSKRYPGWNNKAKRDKAIAPFQKRIDEVKAEITANFPDADLEDMEPESQDSENTSEEPKETFPEGSTESSRRTMSKMKKLFDKAMEKLDKEIEKSTSMRDSEKLEAQRDELQNRFNAAKAKYEEGGSSQDIIDIYEPIEEPEKKDGSESETPSSTNDGGTGEGTTGNEQNTEVDPAIQEQIDSSVKVLEKEYNKKKSAIIKNQSMSPGQKEARLAHLKKTHEANVEAIKGGKSIAQLEADAKAIRDKIPTENNGKPIPGAKHILESARGNVANIVPMPAELVAKAYESVPPGYEIDTDDKGRPLWNGQWGFARDPMTGMYGKIKSDGSFTLSIDPTNPNFKGPKSKEAIEAKKQWLDYTKESQGDKYDPAVDDELRKKANLIARGVETNDEAPDNMTIVANAVAEALQKIND